MLSNVKPLPKILALLAIVGLAVFGASKFLDSRPKTPEVVAAPATSVPAESTQAPVAPVQQAAPVAQAPAKPAGQPVLQPAAPDAGLNNLLK
jgi:predicted lipid-binding transport protein (Tim44 family)